MTSKTSLRSVKYPPLIQKSDVERSDEARDAPVAVRLDDAERVVRRADGEERGASRCPPGTSLDQLVERGVGEGVPVVGQEHVLALEQVAHPAQPLADGGVEPGVGEGDPPVGDVGAQQLHPPAALGQHEVVGHRLVVVEEVVLDRVGPVAEAQDEVAVAVVRVVAHDVPQDRPVADLDHRLGHRLAVLPQAQAAATAEQHDLHRRSASSRGGRDGARCHHRTPPDPGRAPPLSQVRPRRRQ